MLRIRTANDLTYPYRYTDDSGAIRHGTGKNEKHEARKESAFPRSYRNTCARDPRKYRPVRKNYWSNIRYLVKGYLHGSAHREMSARRYKQTVGKLDAILVVRTLRSLKSLDQTKAVLYLNGVLPINLSTNGPSFISRLS